MTTNSNGGTMPDDQVLEWELQNGIGYHNHHYVMLWHNLFGCLHAILGDINSLCDLGAGTGVWATVAKNCGVKKVVAIDQNNNHKLYHTTNGNKKVQYLLQDFTQGITGKYDLITSIEVFEHIPDEKLRPFIATLSKHCKYFLFSSTPHRAPTDEMWGHINIKSTEEWQRIFEANGFKFITNPRTPTTWTMLFQSLENE